jgi:uncharacterized membrane protein YeaQ/YmgE (transglycosylase-associated protein family)
MTLLKPTLEETYKNNEKRLLDIAEREVRWREKRKKFIRNMAIASAIILPVSAQMMAFRGNMSWIAYVLLALVGALLGWVIAKYSIGILRSMFIYLGGAWPTWLLCGLFGWWKSAPIGGMAAVGPLLLMVCGWLGWIVVGAILGMISDMNDDDTIHI